jgi:adenine-specific DNA methylase
MRRTTKPKTFQPSLLAENEPFFPTTRYQGSKAKLVDWLWEQLALLDFSTCLDAFGGTGVVAHRLKKEGKTVTYNDVLRFNYYFAHGLIENSHVRLHEDEVEGLLVRSADITYPSFIYDTFHDIYFTDEENKWLDQTITNIRGLTDPFKFSIAFYALCQACIIKRPYNLFHRKNLYVRFAEVERTFGNKVTWDKPFPELFRVFVDEANRAVFDNNRSNQALNLDAVHVPGIYDLVYVDTPYIPAASAPIDYRDFYHFLEGLCHYDKWHKEIDWQSKHLRLVPSPNDWVNKKRIYWAFDRLFCRFRDSQLAVSYRSDGIPSEAELVNLMRQYKQNVEVVRYGSYKYALSTNTQSKEILIIGI